MVTTARHRGRSPGRWIPVIVSALLGAAVGAGGVLLATSALSSPARPGPPQLGFNDAPVYLYTVPMRKTLAPGEGYTWQCTAKLPTTQVGQLSFTLGPISIAGPVAEG
jgi:hypothetical protein